MKIMLALCVALLVASCAGRDMACLAGTVETGRGCEIANPVQCGVNQVLMNNVCTSTVPATECGLGVTPIWVGERVICSDATPPTPVTNCGQGQIRRYQSDGSYLCVIDPAQQPVPTTCAPGTQLVGSRCEPIPAPINALVECYLRRSSENVPYERVVFTPKLETVASVTCSASRRDGVVDVIKIKPRASERVDGRTFTPDKIGVVYLNTQPTPSGYVATGGGVDGLGYMTISFISQVVIPVGTSKTWYLAVNFEQATGETRYTFEHQSSSATVEAHNADDQLPAEVVDSRWASYGDQVVAVRTTPVVQLAALPAPTSFRDARAYAGSIQLTNPSTWATISANSVPVCIKSTVSYRNYTVRISSGTDYPYSATIPACASQSGTDVGCCTEVNFWGTVPPGTTKAFTVEIDTLAAPARENLKISIIKDRIWYGDGWMSYKTAPTYSNSSPFGQLAEFAFLN